MVPRAVQLSSESLVEHMFRMNKCASDRVYVRLGRRFNFLIDHWVIRLGLF